MDIVDFSLKPDRLQRELVKKLWTCVGGGSGEVFERESVYVNGTGDGLLAAFRSVGCRKLIDVAERFVEGMRHGPHPCEVRVAVHCGAFQIWNAGGYAHIIGSGANECARIVSLGGPGDVVVSEQFISEWNKDHHDIHAEFSPPGGAIEVFVKHGVPQLVRLLATRRNKVVLARRIDQLQAADKLLRSDVLAKVEDVFMVLCTDFGVERTRDAVDARISILMPQDDNEGTVLVPTIYRYQRGLAVVRGSTRYRIGVKPTQGPCAKAYETCQAQHLTGLPSYESEPGAYRRAMARAGVPRELVDGMSRHARAFLCLPIALVKHKIDVIICIDTADPLSRLNKSSLDAIAHNLLLFFNSEIAALWRLRVLA